MRCKYVFYALLFIGSFSCKNDVNVISDPGRLIEVDLLDYELENPETLVKDFTYIPLETDSIHILSLIEKVIPYDERYYIMDGPFPSKVMAFSTSGDFIFEINSIGRGPGEYAALEDFLVDLDSQQIVLLDRGNMKILCYSLDGEFLKEEPFDWYCNEFSKLENGEYICLTGGSNEFEGEIINANLLILNREKRIKNSFIPLNESTDSHTLFPCRLSISAKGTLLAHGLSNTIYRFFEGELSPVYTIDFGQYNIPADLMKPRTSDEAIQNQVMNIVNGPYAKGIYSLAQTGKFLSLVFRFNKEERIQLLIDEESTQTSLLPILHCGQEAYSFPMCVAGDEFIGFWPAHMLLDMVSEDLASEELSKVCEKIDENSNPILVRYKYEF